MMQVERLLLPTAFARTANVDSTFAHRGSLTTFLAKGSEASGRFAPMEYLTKPGNEPPPHVHEREEFAERVCVNQREISSNLRTAYRNPVQFSNREDLNYSGDRLENTRKKEIVVWILVVLLGVITFTAFYLLWLKAGG
jgi:hypothetical protein